VQRLRAIIAHFSEINDAAQVAIERLRGLLAGERTKVQDALQGSGTLAAVERNVRLQEQKVIGGELFQSTREICRLEVRLSEALLKVFRTQSEVFAAGVEVYNGTSELARMQSQLLAARADLYNGASELARMRASLREIGEALYRAEIGRNAQLATERQLNESLQAMTEAAATAGSERFRTYAALRELGEQLYMSQAAGNDLRARIENDSEIRLKASEIEAQAGRGKVLVLGHELYEISRKRLTERIRRPTSSEAIVCFLRRLFSLQRNR
jgi:hypothetical protein